MGRGRPPHPDVLTPAEWRVLEHVRAGRANAEIAVRLGISVNTVRYHLGNILGKLDLPDRAAMAVWEGESRRARMAAPVLWALSRLGSVGRAAAVGLGAVIVAVAIVGGVGGGELPPGETVVAVTATLEASPEEEEELSPAERAARVSARFAASDAITSCFFVRYWGNESGQLVLTDAVFVTFGADSVGGCERLLTFGSNAPVPATDRVAAERTDDDTPVERAARVAITHAAAHPRYVPRGFLNACAALGDESPTLESAPNARDEARLPGFAVNENGCIVLPNPSLLDQPSTIGGGMFNTLPLEACLIQYVEPRGGDVTVWSTTDGSFLIEITPGCGFVPAGSGDPG